jgi:hypothetical protein
MRRTSFRTSSLSIPALVAAAVASVAGCSALSLSSSGSGESTGTGAGGGLILPDAGGAGGSAITTGATGTGGNFTPPYMMGAYTYLCGGESASCVPGNAVCKVIDPSKNDAGIGGNVPSTSATGGGGSGGAGGYAGAGGSPPNDDSSSATGGDIDAGVLAALTCKLAPISGAASAGCTTVGEGTVGNPCQTAADCGVGLACIATPSGGLCRPYCCGEVEACPLDTYCAPVPMAEAAVKIPVCLPAHKCKPLDDSTCTDGQTCTIVRDDGTTSCVDPGDGSRGDFCPCAAGQVCSKITNTCLKLCHIGNDAADCGAGSCQGGVMGYPDGIGICVGYP